MAGAPVRVTQSKTQRVPLQVLQGKTEAPRESGLGLEPAGTSGAGLVVASGKQIQADKATSTVWAGRVSSRQWPQTEQVRQKLSGQWP